MDNQASIKVEDSSKSNNLPTNLQSADNDTNTDNNMPQFIGKYCPVFELTHDNSRDDKLASVRTALWFKCRSFKSIATYLENIPFKLKDYALFYTLINPSILTKEGEISEDKTTKDYVLMYVNGEKRVELEMPDLDLNNSKVIADQLSMYSDVDGLNSANEYRKTPSKPLNKLASINDKVDQYQKELQIPHSLQGLKESIALEPIKEAAMECFDVDKKNDSGCESESESVSSKTSNDERTKNKSSRKNSQYKKGNGSTGSSQAQLNLETVFSD